MSDREEFEEIYSYLEEASGVKLSQEEKEKLREDYQTPKGRRNILWLVSQYKEGKFTKQKQPAKKSLFKRLVLLLILMFVGWISGVGVLFDGTRWWHHVAFIPIGLILFFVLDVFFLAELARLIIAKAIYDIKKALFGQE